MSIELRRTLLAVWIVAFLALAHGPTTNASEANAIEGGGDLTSLDLPDVDAPSMLEGPNEAEMRDLRDLATERGYSLEEAMNRYGWGRNFSQLTAGLVDDYPDEYAGAAIEKDGTAWIAFRGSPPDEALTLIDIFNRWLQRSGLTERDSGPVEVVFDRGFSEAEINRRTMDAHFAVYSSVDGLLEVSTRYDQVSGVISMTIIVGESSDEQRVRDEVTLLVNSEVRLDVVSGPLAEDDAVHRGGQPTSTCTAGFVVYSAQAVRGIATAAHCQDSQAMNGVTLPFVDEHNGSYGDMQWHSKPGEVFPDDFLAGSATTWNADNRDVASMGSPVVGMAIYKNGRNGYRDLDEVKALGHCVNGACNLVRVYQDLAVNGDSGGPWYFGNTAYGIHKGDNLHDWAIRDVFTRVDHLAIGMSVNVAIS